MHGHWNARNTAHEIRAPARHVHCRISLLEYAQNFDTICDGQVSKARWAAQFHNQHRFGTAIPLPRLRCRTWKNASKFREIRALVDCTKGPSAGSAAMPLVAITSAVQEQAHAPRLPFIRPPTGAAHKPTQLHAPRSLELGAWSTPTMPVLGSAAVSMTRKQKRLMT